MDHFIIALRNVDKAATGEFTPAELMSKNVDKLKKYEGKFLTPGIFLYKVEKNNLMEVIFLAVPEENKFYFDDRKIEIINEINIEETPIVKKEIYWADVSVLNPLHIALPSILFLVILFAFIRKRRRVYLSQRGVKKWRKALQAEYYEDALKISLGDYYNERRSQINDLIKNNIYQKKWSEVDLFKFDSLVQEELHDEL